MSNSEYVAACDEDQLKNLIEQANGRLAAIRSTGWVELWTVSAGWGNVAWFAEPDYAAAVDFACRAVKEQAAKKPGGDIEMEVSLERYRPEEVDELLARADRAPASPAKAEEQP